MDSVYSTDSLASSISSSDATVTTYDPVPRTRRMGIRFQTPAPNFAGSRYLDSPPGSPVGSLDTSEFDENDFEPYSPPTLPVTPTSPTTSLSTPSTPPVPPPRSPLRSIPKSVGSFTTLLEQYTNAESSSSSIRDVMARHRATSTTERMDTMAPPVRRGSRHRSRSVSSLSALIDACALGIGTSTSNTPMTPSFDGQVYGADMTYQYSDDKPLPVPPADDSNLPTPTSIGHDGGMLRSAPSASSDVPSTSETSTLIGNSRGPVISKRKHALMELLQSERAYASDLAFIRDVHIPLALGHPVSFHPTTPPGSSGSSSRTLSTASSSSGSTHASSLMLSSSSSTSSTSSSKYKDRPAPGAPMSENDVRIIFGNVAELAVFSDTFSDRLERALGDVLEDGGGEDYVGRLFLSTIPLMEPPYKTYITRHPQALAHLSSLPQTPELKDYLARTQRLAASVTHAWDLPSLLIKPVQRLLKYSLILTTIIENSPDDHGDKQNLKKARQQMEDAARRVNEGRRRIELVKEILSGKTDSGVPLKKKVSVGKAATNSVGMSIGRMKSMGMGLRASRPGGGDESNAEIALVDTYEKDLKRCDAFIRELAKGITSWAASVHATVVHLREWSLNFGQVIGLSEETPSEAFNAYVDLIDMKLGPLCEALENVVQKELIPQFARLLDTSKAPMRLFTAMHSYESLHFALMNMNYGKSRPPTAMIEASQNYLALRAQLAQELPAYLELLDRGIVICIRQLANRQTEFWNSVRDQWGGLWDCLRMEGETNAGCEETLRLWWSRYSEVDEVVSKLHILRWDKTYARSTRSRSSGPNANLASPYAQSQFANSQTPPFTPPAQPSRHRSFGSMDAAMMPHHVRRSPSSESLPVRSNSVKSRPQTPEAFGRLNSHSNTVPIPAAYAAYAAYAASSSPSLISYPSTSTQGQGYRDRDTESLNSNNDRGHKSRSPSFSRKLSESLRAPLRRTPSHKSIGQSSLHNGASTQYEIDESPPLPNVISHISLDSPALYIVTVCYPFRTPDGATYLSLPFFDLSIGDVFDVLSEAGHPSQHHGIPLYIDDDGDDCLLVIRNEDGHIGWALASFMLPIA